VTSNKDSKIIPGSSLDVPPKMKSKDYERQIQALHIELVKAQYWVKAQGERLVLIFEGRDTAGKGGTIKRFREHLNPRGAPHIALPAPSDREQSQFYFQRYLAHLPAGGEIIFFDRSWYNRAGVERVMGFCTKQELGLFLRQAPNIEAGLVEDGIRLFKLYLSVNQDEQRRRLDSRRDDPLKTWKLSPMDLEAVKRWDAYTEAQNDMLLVTHTHAAPWAVINANDKKTARLNAIRHVLSQLPYTDKNDEVARPPDPAIVGTPEEMWPDLGEFK
jgi:polyphosphate kinase 2